MKAVRVIIIFTRSVTFTKVAGFIYCECQLKVKSLYQKSITRGNLHQKTARDFTQFFSGDYEYHPMVVKRLE